MTGLDTNVLVYALVSSQPEHVRARTWLEQYNGVLCTTQTNVGEVLRLLTHRRVFSKPLSLGVAVQTMGAFFQAYSLEILAEESVWWKRLALDDFPVPTIGGNEIFDARIALCLRYHGVRRICTLDSDFRKYPFLEIVSI